MISDSVELCKTEVCFLHIQLIGTNVWLPKIHNVPPEVDFESSSFLCKVRVLEQSQSALFCSVTHMTMLSEVNCVMNVGDQACWSFVTCPCPFGDASNIFNVHEMSGPPIRAKYKHFKTLCAYIGSFSH